MNSIRFGLAAVACAAGLAMSAPATADSRMRLYIDVGPRFVPAPYVVLPAPAIYPYGYQPPMVYHRPHLDWRHHHWRQHYGHPHGHWYRARPVPSHPGYRYSPPHRPGFRDTPRSPHR